MGKLFGTDGIRGVVNKELDALLAFKVGQAAAMVLAEAGNRDGLRAGRERRPQEGAACLSFAGTALTL